MADIVQVQNIDNSFVTFHIFGETKGEETFVTDTNCGVQIDFCYPIYAKADLAFQTNVVSSSDAVFASLQFETSEGVITGATVTTEAIGLSPGGYPIYNVHVSFGSSDFLQTMDDGECFQLYIRFSSTPEVLFESNQCFKKINEPCLTSLINYYNVQDNAFGFYYNLTGITRINKIRLPLYFKEPTLNTKQDVYVRSNGTRYKLWAQVDKKYKGIVDMVTEECHQKLVIGLNHDTVTFITEENISFNCTFENEYNNNFPTIMQNVNLWTSDFDVFVTPFNAFNSNCV